MVRDAKKHGFIPHAPSLKRADGRATMQELALQLKEIIDHDIPFGDNIVIVGFSMGGIVARVYLQRLGGTERVKKTVTIGSPHHGSLWGYLHWGKGAQELRPNSDFLRELQGTEAMLDTMPLLAIHTPLDTSIVPYTSGIWKRARNKRFWRQFHPFMPYSRKIRAEVWKFLMEQD